MVEPVTGVEGTAVDLESFARGNLRTRQRAGVIDAIAQMATAAARRNHSRRQQCFRMGKCHDAVRRFGSARVALAGKTAGHAGALATDDRVRRSRSPSQCGLRRNARRYYSGFLTRKKAAIPPQTTPTISPPRCAMFAMGPRMPVKHTTSQMSIIVTLCGSR